MVRALISPLYSLGVAKCISQDPHCAPHPIRVLTHMRFRSQLPCWFRALFVQKHESGPSSQPNTLLYVYTGYSQSPLRLYCNTTPDASIRFPWTVLLTATFRLSEKKNGSSCFTNHTTHCRTFLFSFFCTTADVPKCFSLCAIARRASLSVLYLKTLRCKIT